MEGHTVLQQVLDALFESKELNSWSISNNNNHGCVCTLRFKDSNKDSNTKQTPMANARISYRKKSLSQQERDRARIQKYTRPNTRSQVKRDDFGIETPRDGDEELSDIGHITPESVSCVSEASPPLARASDPWLGGPLFQATATGDTHLPDSVKNTQVLSPLAKPFSFPSVTCTDTAEMHIKSLPEVHVNLPSVMESNVDEGSEITTSMSGMHGGHKLPPPLKPVTPTNAKPVTPTNAQCLQVDNVADEMAEIMTMGARELCDGIDNISGRMLKYLEMFRKQRDS